MTRPVVVLHIGAMKTGTTFLQHLLMANREGLRDAGVEFAGARWADQVAAVQDVLGLGGTDPFIRAAARDAWPALVRELTTTSAPIALVSMEFLSFARGRQVSRIRRDLADYDVHVILTVRDAQLTIPAQWQTSVGRGATDTWPEFLVGVRRAMGPAWPVRALLGDDVIREFRRAQDIPRMLRTWQRVVPPERLHVVTVPGPRSDPMELWQRFCTAVGINPAVATEPPDTANPSLGYASAELVRRLNVGVSGRVLQWEYNRTLKRQVTEGTLSLRRRQETRATLDAATRQAALDWNAHTLRALRRCGAHLVGDEADLPVTPVAEHLDRDPTPEPTDAELFAAAQAAAEPLVRMVRRRRRRLAALTGTDSSAPVRAPGWVASDGPADLDLAVEDLTALAVEACQLAGEIARRSS